VPGPDASSTLAPPRFSETAEALLAYAGIFAATALTAHLVPSGVQEYAYSIILAAMVWLPVTRADRRRWPLAVYGITFANWKPAVKTALLWMAILFPLFILGNHLWRAVVFHKTFAFALPDRNLAYLAVEQVLFIALPEEFFYRGFLQSAFARRWPNGRRLFGGDFGKAVWLASLLFAIAHLAAIPAPFRLAVFFPSLWFGWLRSKTDSLVAPILVHGLSNVLQAFLIASYH